MAVGALAAAAAVAVLLAALAGVEGPAAVPAIARSAAAAVVLFGVCGLAPAALLPADLRAERALFVLPLGAAAAALELSLLGLLHVPLGWSLALVLAANVALAVWLRLRGAPAADRPPARDRLVEIGMPLALAACVAAIALVPVLRTGQATVVGQNGDAVLAVGTAELLRHAPPTAVRPELALDRVPPVWRSKVPIYYALAGVTALSGQDVVAVFPTMAAVMLALVALGLYHLARRLLGAPPAVALAVAFLVPLTRTSLSTAIHPFYNQLWGLFALLFALLFIWRYLDAPTRPGFALAAAFTALAAFAYPLALPFPALFAAVVAAMLWRRRRAEGRRPGWLAALGLPRLRRAPIRYALAALVAVPVLASLVRGVGEKIGSAAMVVLPGSDLGGWSGQALPYLPLARFLGIDVTGAAGIAAAAAVLALAGVGLLRVRREVAVALAVVGAGALVAALSFRLRGDGQLFHFKILGFLGPLALALAAVGLAAAAGAARRRLPRLLAGAAAAALAVMIVAGARNEIGRTYAFATPQLLELREWDRSLPPDASVRIDLRPGGYQLWSWYFLDDRRLSASRPIAGFFPHPPVGFVADYSLIEATGPPPPDAVGQPVRRNADYALYRLRPHPELPEVSSRRLVWPYEL